MIGLEELFRDGNKTITLSDIFKNIYKNSTKKDAQIKRLIISLEPMIKSLSDAAIVVPLIKEYLEISVKNDEQIVKLAAIAQRIISSKNRGSGRDDGELVLSDAEIKELKESIEAVQKEEEQIKESLQEAVKKEEGALD